MSIVKIVHTILFIVGAMVCVYMIGDLVYQKNKLKNGKIEEIKNYKYIIIIIVEITLFVVYGFMRNMI